MDIDISQLRNGNLREIEIDETIKFEKSYFPGTDLIDLTDVEVHGIIEMNVNHEYEIHCTVSGIMVLPCAVTLKPVSHQFSTEIDGSIEEMLKEIDEKKEKVENTIDILPIIWENILMEIPLRVVGEELGDISLHGDGWRLITEREEQVETNPELEKLKDLL